MSPSRRDGTFTQSPGRASGFTLVEALVTVAVLGFAAAVVMVNVFTMVTTAKLEASADELTSFLRDVPGWAKRVNGDVSCSWQPSSRRVTVTVAATGVELDRFEFPDHLVVTPTTDVVYRCDPMGRAYLGADSRMLSSCPQMTATHSSFASEDIDPDMFFSFVLTPLWHVEVVKHM